MKGSLLMKIRLENENDYLAINRRPRFTTSNLYFKVWRDFDEKNQKNKDRQKVTKNNRTPG